MSGAQGAQPKDAFTATTYSMAKEENPKDGEMAGRRENLHSREDAVGVPVKFEADQVKDAKNASGQGGPVFGNSDDTDLGVTGTS